MNLSIGNIYLNVTGEAVDDPTYFPANNTFSPNDDGINDFWEIENSELYENCDFYIYDHLQNIIYQSKGYNNDWNGKYKGKELPMGTYYYYVVCQDCGDCKYSGAISIIR